MLSHYASAARQSYRSTYRYLVTINLFENNQSMSDPQQLKNQLMSTRLFVILFICSFFTILTYMSSLRISETHAVPSPSFAQYQKLYQKYPKIISCPCSNIDISYDKVVFVRYTLHQLCVSQFITHDWIQIFNTRILQDLSISNDFRVTGLYAFQALRSLCGLLNDSIANNLHRFYLNRYVSVDVTPVAVFDAEMQSSIEKFKSATKREFLTTLRTWQDVTQANLFLTTTQSNAVITMLSENDTSTNLRSRSYDDCSCFQTDRCTSSSAIYHMVSQQKLFDMPGMKTGCYVIQALLQSSLECMYDEGCLETLTGLIGNGSFWHIAPLSLVENSPFAMTDTVESMLEELFVEEWGHKVLFEKYFSECEPKWCTFNVKTRANTVYIITTVIGVVGGLETGLRLLIPIVIQWLRNLRIKNRINTGSVVVQSLSQRAARSLIEFRRLNLFARIPPSTDQHELENQFISTRLFILLFMFSLTVLLIYSSAFDFTRTRTLSHPTVEQYQDLYNKYPQTLTCPCTEISIDYEKFLRVNYTLHPICSSHFVSEEWIRNLYMVLHYRIVSSLDFRVSGLLAFQALRALCSLANDNIINSLSRLMTNRFIQIDATPALFFRSEAQSIFDEFRTSTVKQFSASINMVRQLTQSNFYLSAMQSNAFIHRSRDTPYYQDIRARNYGDCSCSLQSNCTGSSAIYDGLHGKMLFNVDGLKVGCFVLEALLQSDLRCFHDIGCLEQLNIHLDNILVNVSTISINVSSRFSPLSSMQELLQELFVERWNSSARYADYYTVCNPLYCTFVVKTNNGIIAAVAIIIGLAGGLMKGLKMMIPFLVNLVRKKRERITALEEASLISRASAELREHLQNIRRLNLFISQAPASNPDEVKTQIITTRLFIIMIICSTLVLTIYTSAVSIDQTIIRKSPMIDEYLQLQDRYSQTLSCPCNHIAVDYQAFLRINFTLHQVCSSYFVTRHWIYQLENAWNDEVLSNMGFRKMGRWQFQALASLCILVGETITKSRDQLYTTRYVSLNVPPMHVFQSQISQRIDAFKSWIAREFLSSLRVIRDITQANSLFAASETNAYIAVVDGSYARIMSKRYDSCSCFGGATCTTVSSLFRTPDAAVVFRIPGFKLGCYSLESLLQSHLGCFYNHSCFTQLVSYFHPNIINTSSVILDSSVASRFAPNTSVEDLLEGLMVENWTESIKYSNYFMKCKPTHCSYTIKTKRSAIVTIVTVTGLIGGLTSVLKIAIPYSVRMVYHIIRRKANEIQPVASIKY